MKKIIEKHGEVNVTEIPQNFIYPEIKETDYVFGSGQLDVEILRPDGDWRDYLPPEEEQKRNGTESSACYIEASQHAIATLMEEKYDIKDSNFSSRFNALLSEGTPVGGSPLRGAQSIRDDGLIPDSMLPFSDEIKSWDDFHSFKGQSESLCKLTGKEWRKEWDPRYETVFTKNEPVEIKYARIAERLKSGTLVASVTAWYEKNGVYVKPLGMNDGHLIEITYLTPQCNAIVRDTYPPFEKKLEPWFNFDYCMFWNVNRTTISPQPTGFWYNIINFIISLFKK
jgi:hypothetical protein